ncbi:hypothetical protein V1503_19135 [Bacillus sp. SCS-151]|uniref:hypothetical protein n=1 Tax=Nanhaiella sioensis TaxID=3115293 RepID=UPI0039787EC9
MIKPIGVFFTVIILFLTGCNNEKSLLVEKLEQLNEKVVEVNNTIKEQQKVIDELNKEFSYLKDLSEKELDAYELFAQDKDIRKLLGFSPEKIVLIYFHSVVIDDIEALYSLTYDDGTLPDFSIFKQKYYQEGLHKKDLETTLDFRYYNSIEVSEENKTDNYASVEMSVDFGLFHPTVILGLKKENEIWKMDILHLV